MRVNRSVLQYGVISKISKLLLIYTPETSLDIEKSNSSSFSETITGKRCTKFKIKESLDNFCIQWKESFSSKRDIRMYSSGSAMWKDETLKDLIKFWSSRRRSHSMETFFNSNWLCGRFCCFFFIFNKLLCCRRGNIESILELFMLDFILTSLNNWDFGFISHMTVRFSQ